MIRAYSEYYLGDAKDTLSQFFDYLINDCGIGADLCASIFLSSGYAEQFERGNPAILSGMSGIELAMAVVEKTYQNKLLPAPRYSSDLSPEYWAGWALAEYQWFSAKRFNDIFGHCTLSGIIAMYPLFHEMDIMRFIERMDELCNEPQKESKLKKLRESRGLSQSELSRLSGVSLRSIQMYEQKVNDIDKAQVHALYKLSRVLGCEIEDLLEKPME